MAEIYDFDVIMTENSSHLYVLQQIRPNCRILECGCATGYMTKYLKEKLDAQVWIVEFNEEAFEKAKQYAVDGICANLEETEIWPSKFEGLEFDYILFADVLEHLRNPDEVLKKAVSMLSENGEVIVSLPNVAHADILIKLYYNQWNYTPMGLLDDTHIHFWAYENIEGLFKTAGLTPVLLDYTIVPPFCTEQGKHSLNEQNFEAIYKICKRPFSDVYQFIITAKKTDCVLDNKIVCEDRYEERHAAYGSDLHMLEGQFRQAQTSYENLKASYEGLQADYKSISNSTIWRLTKPLRVFLDAIKRVFK